MNRHSPPPYEDVAAIIKDHPTRYAPLVAERFGIAVRTAQKWVREGRMLGVIPPVAQLPCSHCGGTGVGGRYGPGKAALSPDEHAE